jgi:hypothetical protein
MEHVHFIIVVIKAHMWILFIASSIHQSTSHKHTHCLLNEDQFNIYFCLAFQLSKFLYDSFEPNAAYSLKLLLSDL